MTSELNVNGSHVHSSDRAALEERVADLVRFNHDPIAIANEAIALIRAETLEEAARVADENLAWDTAAAIRAMKGKPNE
jgi:CHASE3 domain sensor protein